MLELLHVTRRFVPRNARSSLAPTVAVDDVSLQVPAGTTAAIIGPSGCGKSTILRLVIGLIWPDAGEVRLGQVRIHRGNVGDLRHRMGYVIQDGGLFPHLTARQNVTLMARHLGWKRSATQTRVDELVELTQFPADGMDRYPAQLSGGQQQRVSLMRALMLDPDILLLDEPLGALDPLIRSELQAELKRIFASLGKTVLLVTHDLAEAAYLSRDIVVMRDGRVLQRGPLRDLISRPADEFVERFVTAQRSHAEVIAEDAA
jgi:osmoprotectant transport system ATP-binding protein